MDGEQDRKTTQDLLSSLEPQFVRLGADLSYARIQALKGLAKEFNNAMQYISGNADVDISVEYVISDYNALNFSLEEVTSLLKKRLEELHDAELSSGQLFGGSS